MNFIQHMKSLVGNATTPKAIGTPLWVPTPNIETQGINSEPDMATKSVGTCERTSLSPIVSYHYFRDDKSNNIAFFVMIFAKGSASTHFLK